MCWQMFISGLLPEETVLLCSVGCLSRRLCSHHGSFQAPRRPSPNVDLDGVRGWRRKLGPARRRKDTSVNNFSIRNLHLLRKKTSKASKKILRKL